MWGRARKFTTQLLQNSTVHIFLILLHILVPAPYSIYKGSGEKNTAMLPPTSDLTIAIEAPNFSAKQHQKTRKKWSHRKSPLLFLLPSSLRPLTPKSSDRKPLQATGKQNRRHRHNPKPKQNKTGGKKTERERDSTKEAKAVSKKKKKILGKPITDDRKHIAADIEEWLGEHLAVRRFHSFHCLQGRSEDCSSSCRHGERRTRTTTRRKQRDPIDGYLSSSKSLSFERKPLRRIRKWASAFGKSRGEKFFPTPLVVWFVSWDPICEGTLGAPPSSGYTLSPQAHWGAYKHVDIIFIMAGICGPIWH